MGPNVRQIALLFFAVVVAAIAIALLVYVGLSPLEKSHKWPIMVGLFVLTLGLVAIFFFVARRWGPYKLIAAGIGFFLLMPSLSSNLIVSRLISVITQSFSEEKTKDLKGWALEVLESTQEVTWADGLVLFVGVFMVVAGIYWDVQLRKLDKDFTNNARRIERPPDASTQQLLDALKDERWNR